MKLDKICGAIKIILTEFQSNHWDWFFKSILITGSPRSEGQTVKGHRTGQSRGYCERFEVVGQRIRLAVIIKAIERWRKGLLGNSSGNGAYGVFALSGCQRVWTWVTTCLIVSLWLSELDLMPPEHYIIIIIIIVNDETRRCTAHHRWHKSKICVHVCCRCHYYHHQYYSSYSNCTGNW